MKKSIVRRLIKNTNPVAFLSFDFPLRSITVKHSVYNNILNYKYIPKKIKPMNEQIFFCILFNQSVFTVHLYKIYLCKLYKLQFV